MASIKKYWKSVEELKDSSVVETLSKNEFVEDISTVCWFYNSGSLFGSL